MKLTIDLPGRSDPLELTVEQARELHRQLGDVFDQPRDPYQPLQIFNEPKPWWVTGPGVVSVVDAKLKLSEAQAALLQAQARQVLQDA